MALNFPIFDDIKVSTKTFIAVTNLEIDIRKLFDSLPITEYQIVPKKRGRKKKIAVIDPNKNIPIGSIITLDYEGNIRGVDIKKKKNRSTKNRGNYFRNSVTIIMTMPDNKKINFKVSKNGKFQLTGCKIDSHAENCIEYIWGYIKDNKEIYTMVGEHLRVMFIPAMRNIDFDLGFLVNREKLDMYVNEKTNYHSLLETSFGYTGVNIKLPIIVSMDDIKIKQREYIEEKWVDSMIPYNNYMEQLPEKEREKKLNTEKFNTFLVFHSGKTIMSGSQFELMKPTYYEFTNIIKKCHNIIEENLDTK
jgi:TATA-box binding protein (TBP) (component of TFIID and TFIIIB)